jgi:hypothetical protein
MTSLVLNLNVFSFLPSFLPCSSSFGASRDYETIFSSTGIHHDDRAHMITLEMSIRVFYFDLTPDREAHEEHMNLPLPGNVRIEPRYNKPLPEPVTCILFAEFPGVVEIDKVRRVTVE